MSYERRICEMGNLVSALAPQEKRQEDCSDEHTEGADCRYHDLRHHPHVTE